MSLPAADPLERVWDALAEAGCEPRGDRFRFGARCPAHNDRHPSLRVFEGADRRVGVFCYAGCRQQDILEALKLRRADLFPLGHYRAAPPPRRASHLTPAATLLEALHVIGTRWSGVIALESCPYCSREAAWLRIKSSGTVDVECLAGCGRPDVLKAIETRVAIEEAQR